MTTIEHLLPPSLLLGPHLSAYRYFFVCTLTIASWDTLVLTTRSWRMSKTKEWPILKILMLLLRHLMPIEFIILAVSCFNPAFTPAVCAKSYLFEPIMTAILLSLSSLALGIRVRAIYDGARGVTFALSTLFILQIAAHFAACFFYFPLNLQNQQGCIAAPKHNWVGIYWVGPTLFYAVCLGLAVNRSLISLKERPLGLWKLINRDGLNLYTTIFAINFINIIYFFVTKPKNDADPLKIIVSSLATVLTTTMTMRVILLVRGSLVAGGSFHGSSAPTSNSMSNTHPTSANNQQPFHITAGGNSSNIGNRSKASGAPSSGAATVPSTKLSQPTFAIARGHGGEVTMMSDMGGVDEDVYDMGEGKGPHAFDEDVNVWEGDKDSRKGDN